MENKNIQEKAQAEKEIKESKDEDARVSSESGEKSKKKKKNVKPKDVKYRMTFLIGRPFQGEYRPKGESIIVDELIFKTYQHRVNEFSFTAE